ncbi:MAG TPA: hypothetical protein VGV65_07325 [Nocardioides sp.]|nr:hypothetical protein [Nocardioides sp.]
MPPDTRALTPDSLGAWLVKARGSDPATQAHARAGFADVDTRCVRPTYRTELVRAGQRVLLWVSGNEAELPAGIHAQGRTTGAARDGVIPVELTPVSSPLLRSELVGHPELAAMEVLKMPAGSNPSYVTPEQLRVLTEMCPELAGDGG